MRKGQSASGASALIGIMTLIFIFYIIFLPPSERQELLQEGVTEEGGTAVQTGTLLREIPGKISFVEQEVFDHLIPNIALVETKYAAILGRESPFTVKKSIWGEDTKSFRFNIDDLENTENVMLNFQVLKGKGVLHIELNGETIFENTVQIQNPPPIQLPKNLLRDTNVLFFKAMGGIMEGKEYSLTDVKILGDITDKSAQEATNTFRITDTEYDNLRMSYLDFYPICDQTEAGIMRIYVNGKVVYSAVPACESPNRQELYLEDLRSGKNTVIFEIDKGAFRIEDIRVRNSVEPTKAFIDFFDISDTLYDQVVNGEASVVLKIEFVDERDRKQAEVNINGRLDAIDQYKREYEREISNIVGEGNNYIEILPLTDLNIAKLEVRVE
ncbi:hypothetical protein KY329_02860 [Candidatus Woesearchaeota archaeon]|nr:hypothetical protein [Candidatus Woesearchaeota archaeon]